MISQIKSIVLRQIATNILLLSITLAAYPQGNTYYVSNSGINQHTSSEAQSPDTPWKTLNKASSFNFNFKLGDSVLFRFGDEFFGNLSIGLSGTLNLSIVFYSYGNGDKPIISGARSDSELDPIL